MADQEGVAWVRRRAKLHILVWRSLRVAWHWLAIRFPHFQIQFSQNKHPFFSCFRLYGFKPYFALRLLDWTRINHHTGHRPETWFRIGPWGVYHDKQETEMEAFVRGRT